LSGGAENREPAVREAVRAKRYAVTHDALIALAGATGGEPGVVVIAGTGSIAFGRNSQGRTARAGGWGYAFGDEGGAFDIVRQALRAALRFEEGWGAKTTLAAALIEAGRASSADDLLHRLYAGDFSSARVAGFAPIVDEIARAGDAVAIDILNGAAQALATIAAAVRAQLFAREEAAVFSYVGGAFQSAILLERFRMLIELNDSHRVVAPKYRPAEGALLEAYRIAGQRAELHR
jgi:N-acetylglucosamine kinase-like BadF-type ATPase